MFEGVRVNPGGMSDPGVRWDSGPNGMLSCELRMLNDYSFPIQHSPFSIQHFLPSSVSLSIALFVAFAITRAVVVAIRVARAVRPVIPLVPVTIGALTNRIVPIAIAAVVHPLPIAVRVAACVRRLLVAAGSLLRPEHTRSVALAV